MATEIGVVRETGVAAESVNAMESVEKEEHRAAALIQIGAETLSS